MSVESGKPAYRPSANRRVDDLVAMSTPLPGVPDVTRATDERVFDPEALRELHAALDRLPISYRRPR